MAVRFIDGFDHYNVGTQKWDSVATMVFVADPRTGTQSVRGGSSGNNRIATKVLDAQGTWVVGFAYKRRTNDSRDLVHTMDGGSEQGVLRIVDTNKLALDRGGTEVARSGIVFPDANVFYYVEFKHIIDNSAGLLEVRVDRAVAATFTGDTQNTGNATADRISIHDDETAGNQGRFDDLYILDGTGGSNDDYLGDQQVNTLYPDGAGNYTEFATLFGAATHQEAVDEAIPDDDTSYVEESVVDDRDTFTFDDHPLGSATINGIQVMMRAKKTAAGDAELARLYRRGSDDQGADVALQTSYAYIREIMETDPIAAGAWTIANLNAAEFGVRVR